MQIIIDWIKQKRAVLYHIVSIEWNVHFPSCLASYVEALPPKVMVFIDGEVIRIR